ncbi:MAG: NAD(P)-dependent oxidoreductase [Gemmatirosa sp.]|nr:NAD(P)-dependent oxidoreductase [Gemmatirosa sp.]
MPNEPRIALLGLGVMGAGMAHRLLDAGLPLAVHNRTRSKAEPLGARGARIADTPREAAAGADVVIAMLADDGASCDTWLGADGALAGAAPGTVLVEASTVTPEWIAELARAAAGRGCPLLDAPVTGSKAQAASGALRFLVGGDAAALERARPVLSVLGQTIVHLGPTGSGALLKLVNNFLCGVQAAALAEAVALVERSTLDPQTAFDVLTNGAPGSPLVKSLLPRMTARDYVPNFHLALMGKDLAYAQRTAEGYGLELASAATARATFQRAVAAGLGESDFSAVVEPLRP